MAMRILKKKLILFNDKCRPYSILIPKKKIRKTGLLPVFFFGKVSILIVGVKLGMNNVLDEMNLVAAEYKRIRKGCRLTGKKSRKILLEPPNSKG